MRYYIFDNDMGYSDAAIAFVKVDDASRADVYEVKDIARWCGFPLLVAVFSEPPDIADEKAWMTLDVFMKNHDQEPGCIDATPMFSGGLLNAPSRLLAWVAAFEEASCATFEDCARRNAPTDTEAMRTQWKESADHRRARAAVLRAELARRAKEG